MAQMQAVVGLFERLMNEAQVAAAVGSQVTAGILPLFAIAKAGTEDPRHALVHGSCTKVSGSGMPTSSEAPAVAM